MQGCFIFVLIAFDKNGEDNSETRGWKVCLR